jgi:hypothetical protein
MRTIAQLLLFSCLLIGLLFACEDSGPAPTVVGKWTEQGGAAWEFTADGKVIIKQNDDATYSLTGDKSLTINYNDERNFAVDFTFELDGGKLILRPEQAHGDGALPTDWEEPTVLVRAS